MIDALLFYLLAVVIAVAVPALIFESYMLNPPRKPPCGRWRRVIYAGLPGWLDDGGEAELRGPATIPAQIHFNGRLTGYTGSYTVAVARLIRQGVPR